MGVNMHFDKNFQLDDKLSQMNQLLRPLEEQEMGLVGRPESPNLLLLGSPRSGSTLFMQWAASLGVFSYPSNFLSRFYHSPYLGALIFDIVTNPENQYQNEFSDIKTTIEFASTIGKTSGFMAPHDFWYFWRALYPFPDIPCSDAEFDRDFNYDALQRELALIQKAFKKPFICKGRMLTWYLSSVSQKLDDVLYVHLYRNPLATIRSLFHARERWTGSLDTWFSWKTREYELLSGMDVYHQVAGQVYFMEKEILMHKAELGSRYLSVSYEQFCNQPEAVYALLCGAICQYNPRFEIPEYSGPSQFSISNHVSPEDPQLARAWDYFQQHYGTLVHTSSIT
jgi:LPS sulfotransferase NodH